MLSSSDCESLSVGELLALEPDAADGLIGLGLCYTEVAGSRASVRSCCSATRSTAGSSTIPQHACPPLATSTSMRSRWARCRRPTVCLGFVSDGSRAVTPRCSSAFASSSFTRRSVRVGLPDGRPDRLSPCRGRVRRPALVRRDGARGGRAAATRFGLRGAAACSLRVRTSEPAPGARAARRAPRLSTLARSHPARAPSRGMRGCAHAAGRRARGRDRLPRPPSHRP
jgi:hypothetical protein